MWWYGQEKRCIAQALQRQGPDYQVHEDQLSKRAYAYAIPLAFLMWGIIILVVAELVW
jgi:hypothetical protein